MSSELLDALKSDMESAIEAFRKQLSGVRTGRAAPALIENLSVFVSSYGSAMPLKQIASVAAPDARMLTAQPWDKSTISDIEKAIGSAGLGLNPSNDGKLVRIPIPPLTVERRKALAKTVREMGEEAKVRVRGVRREYNELVKAMLDDKDITEDESKSLQKKVQEATDKYVTVVDDLVAKKDAEISEV